MLVTDDTAYRFDGELVLPQPLAAAGWNPKQQSGHVIAPLLGHLIEKIPSLSPMLTTRCVIDLTRQVPMKPLRWHSEVIREGKKLQVVRAALLDGDQEVASLTALRARLAESPAMPISNSSAPADGSLLQGSEAIPGVEIRAIGKVRNDNAVCTLWSRTTSSFVAGAANTPFMHALSLADFGSGMGNAMPFSQWTFPNIDIVVMFFREPRGEWLLLDAKTETVGNGLGLVSSMLADAEGPFARCHQTLFINPVAQRTSR